MRKILYFLFIGAAAASFFVCKGDQSQNLGYSSVSAYEWVQASVKNRSTKDGVMWFQLFDQVNNDNIAKGYQGSAEKFDKYPATISPDSFVWILVNNRFEIRLMADNKSKDFQSTERLEGFLRKFDLGGMEKYTGPKLSGEEMKKFI